MTTEAIRYQTPRFYGLQASGIFAPGGSTVPITPVAPLPVCSSLPEIYGYDSQYGGPNSGTKPCDISVNKDGAVFAVAHPEATSSSPWACNLPPTGAGNEGVICRWKAAPTAGPPISHRRNR